MSICESSTQEDVADGWEEIETSPTSITQPTSLLQAKLYSATSNPEGKTVLNRVLGEPKGKGAPFSRRKLEVLKASAKLFNERGFRNTTMDDIAAALHVTKPAIYYYAKSKDELLFEIGAIALNESSDLLEESTTKCKPVLTD